eukprot:2546424-Prymnesium_polylepis.3
MAATAVASSSENISTSASAEPQAKRTSACSPLVATSSSARLPNGDLSSDAPARSICRRGTRSWVSEKWLPALIQSSSNSVSSRPPAQPLSDARSTASGGEGGAPSVDQPTASLTSWKKAVAASSAS